jgi:hypothetical protein
MTEKTFTTDKDTILELFQDPELSEMAQGTKRWTEEEFKLVEQSGPFTVERESDRTNSNDNKKGKKRSETKEGILEEAENFKAEIEEEIEKAELKLEFDEARVLREDKLIFREDAQIYAMICPSSPRKPDGTFDDTICFIGVILGTATKWKFPTEVEFGGHRIGVRVSQPPKTKKKKKKRRS